MVNVAVPSIAGGLHTSLGTAAWTVSGYLLGLACGLAVTPGAVAVACQHGRVRR